MFNTNEMLNLLARGISGEASRVLLFYLSSSYDNKIINYTQKEIATKLGINQPQISRANSELIEREIIKKVKGELYFNENFLQHRLKVNRPNRNQFIEIIRNANDKISKRIALCRNGKFIILESTSSDAEHEYMYNRNKYVVISESFERNTGYVGYDASIDEKYIDQMYEVFLYLWIKYKEENELQGYVDICIFPKVPSYIESEKIIDNLN